MDAILPVHIVAGTLSVLGGAAALILGKGGRAHRAAGTLFVVSMVIMAVTAAQIGSDDPGNTVAATLTIYMIATAWVTVRRKDKRAGIFEVAAFIVAIFAAISVYYGAFRIASGAVEAENPFIFGVTLILGTALALAALGDISVVLRRGISGAQRIARHLWRMCFGLFIAVGSFAAQGVDALPAGLPRGEMLMAAMALVLGAMFYWLVRVLFTRWYARVVHQS
jgi:hypothetical protein